MIKGYLAYENLYGSRRYVEKTKKKNWLRVLELEVIQAPF